ncbi:Redoxin, partial [Auriculariales sp. MPI-PUGE-AT-0066]
AISLKTSDWKGKRVLVVAVPGAVTRTCHGQIPGYHKLEKEFKAKGIDEIAVLATNDAFVQNGWGRFMGIKDELIFISDTLGKFSAALGLANDKGTGIRAARYVLLISREGTVEKLLVEPGAGVTLTAAESVLAGL